MLRLLKLFCICFFIITSCKKIDISHITKIQTGEFSIHGSYISVKGVVIDIGEKGIVNYGHCWSSTNDAPTISDLKTQLGSASKAGEYSSELKNLSANTIYYFRSYATDGENIVYGDTKFLNTFSVSGMAVSTTQATIIDESSITIDGGITGIGSIDIIDYGHCWAQSNNPTIADFYTAIGLLQKDISFSSSISSLSLETKYYVRAYAKLGNSTVLYSSNATVFIPDLKIVTDTISIPTGNNAIFQGTIKSLGIYPVTDYGHCWSDVTSNPNVNNNKISLGATSSTGVFYTNLTLTPGTTYYYRAYSIANSTVKYGIVKKIAY